MQLGMSFEQTIEAATARPARIMGLEDQLGTLRPGALADVALFRIERGDHTFYDVHMNPRRGQALVRNTLTIINGRPLPLTTDGPQAPWIELSEDQQALIERGHTPAALAGNPAAGVDRHGRAGAADLVGGRFGFQKPRRAALLLGVTSHIRLPAHTDLVPREPPCSHGRATPPWSRRRLDAILNL